MVPEVSVFFATPAEFRRWFEGNHEKTKELWVGFYKKSTGKPSITWPESVDAALCFGWIDGIRKRIDDVSYAIRFTPRKPGSNWSAINIGRVQELMKQGRMHPAGIQAFETRVKEKSGVYTYEQRHTIQLNENYEKIFRANLKAWEFFQKQAPSYRKIAVYWVMSAKQEETRAKRLAKLIEGSQKGRRI